jgi:glycosyltransferase involved in cell wall biosynthesis
LLQYARGLWKRGKIAPGPDCIIITIPTPFSDFVAVKLAQRHGAELITDFRDLWPELFTMVFPSKMRLLINVFLYPLYFLRKYAFNNSSAVTAVCETYLKLVHKICPQSANKPSEIIYSTTVQINNFQSMMGNNNGYKPVVKKESDDIWAIYAGTLGNNYDIESLLQASKLLMSDENGNKIKIVVAGDGPLKNRLEQFIEQDKITNLYYVGILNISQLCKYFAKSDIGLSIYAPDSTVVIPAKAFDYFAAQLPIVNSLNGEFADLIQREGLGVQYDAGNPQSLAEALISLAADEERRKSMVDRIGTIAPNFDRDLQYSKILHLLPSKNK